ncbi:hypothetical protein PVAND_015964 [Polypedilum vanderplanki]|uniref:Uncharacterized protein n=1 Tax=Polypedilum vanderplanki TaxID=319348 RepID=A0A9J6BEG7_POLVA|nr:hypothetical protein PVAND_015964 [Polypedilum vanderplanki]
MSVNDVLRSPPNQQHLHQQYQKLVSAAAANIVAQNQNNCNGLNSPVKSSNIGSNKQLQIWQLQCDKINQCNHHHQHHDTDAAMRIHQAEALLRSQAEAALRLAVSQAAAVVASNSSESNNGNQFRHHNGMAYGQNHHQNNSAQIQSQFSPDLSEALRLQEQRLEQALRLHNSELGLHQQQSSATMRLRELCWTSSSS